MRAREPIERLAAFPADFDARHRAARVPAIITGAAAAWPAARWTPQSFRARCGDVETTASVQLPEAGVVYLQQDRAHRRTLRVAEFVDLMEAGACCYIDQAELARFPGLAGECPADSLLPPGRRFVNLWVGARTRSGLHYDPMDNFLVQLHGDKTAVLAPPGARRALYPFPDNVAKSRIDADAPDERRYPRVAQVGFLEGVLSPGDLLYIPRGWWHHLRARASSISLNLWHEPALGVAEELRALAELGPACWARVARDFLWHGVLRRPYARRLYSPPPTGKQLYDLFAMGLAGKPLP